MKTTGVQRQPKPKSKYNSRKVIVNGITFDSSKEGRRYSELLLLEQAGEITDLELQKKFVLIPAQFVTVGYKKNNKPITRCAERECTYIADFCYTDKNGEYHVEDVKGYKKSKAYDVFVIKRKLMRQVHGLIIEEV